MRELDVRASSFGKRQSGLSDVDKQRQRFSDFVLSDTSGRELPEIPEDADPFTRMLLERERYALGAYDDVPARPVVRRGVP